MSVPVTTYGNSYDGFIKIASALRKAKANGLSAVEARAVEEEMLRFWAASKRVNIHEAFYLMGLNEVLKKGKGLTADNLVMLDKFIQSYNIKSRGSKAELHSSLRDILRGDYGKVLQIIVHAGEGSRIATMMLKGCIKDMLNIGRLKHSIDLLVKRLVESEISESMIRHMLPILREDPDVTKNKLWTELETALQENPNSGWTKAPVKDAGSTKRSKRKRNSAWGIGIAPARRIRALKSQKHGTFYPALGEARLRVWTGLDKGFAEKI